MTSNQSLPPGWRLDARSPSSEHRECSIRITTPEGREISFTHKPFQFACEITRQLEAALSALAVSHEAPAAYRIARPEQVRAARGRRSPGVTRLRGRADDAEPAPQEGVDDLARTGTTGGVEL
ncbi:MAG TPA: hypothetical protein VGD42_05105 [Lysobacter sp.]